MLFPDVDLDTKYVWTPNSPLITRVKMGAVAAGLHLGPSLEPGSCRKSFSGSKKIREEWRWTKKNGGVTNKNPKQERWKNCKNCLETCWKLASPPPQTSWTCATPVAAFRKVQVAQRSPSEPTAWRFEHVSDMYKSLRYKGVLMNPYD